MVCLFGDGFPDFASAEQTKITTMEVKAGYKQTEVGVIPEDWCIEPLSEVVKPERPISYGIVQTGKPILNGVKCIRVIDIIDGNIDESQLITTSKQISDSYKRTILEEGDLMIALRGKIGEVAITNKKLVSSNLTRGVALISLKKKYSTVFFQQQLKSENSKRVLENNLNGSALKELAISVLRKIPVAFPSTLKEQTVIATTLSDTDALISSLEKLIAKKRNIKQGAMQKLLHPKEGWKVKQLGDFLDYEQPTKYLVSNTEYDDNNQIPVLTAGKTFILGYTDEEHGIFNNLPVIIFDDFTTAIKFVDFPFKAKSSAMKMLLPKNDKVNLRFIYEVMLQIKYPLGDHKRHWIGEYRQIEIIVPSTPEEQSHIATILSDMDAEITSLETKLEKYKNVKLGMMQTLLTGKIRLV
jgi:type I restriction enzyme, S subunit